MKGKAGPCVTQIHNAQHMGRVGPKGRQELFTFKFFLSCHKILILFHNDIRKLGIEENISDLF